MKRIYYRGRLRLPTGYHTGDGRRLTGSDQPLFRRRDGRLELSGTSLAGVLRADVDRVAAALGESCRVRDDEAERHGCVCTVCRLFGPRSAEGKSHEDEDVALRVSHLSVSGGPAEQPQPRLRNRDRVGIDRKSRTAAAERKYDIEIADGIVEFPFRLRIDRPDDNAAEVDAEIALIEHTLARMAHGWLFLGGKSSSGQGRADLVSLDKFVLDLGRLENLVEHLLKDDESAGCEPPQVLVAKGVQMPLTLPEDAGHFESTPDSPISWGQLRLRLDLEFPTPMLVNDPAAAAASGVDHVTVERPDDRPLLPGSSVRGSLRARAEQILRTRLGDAGACDLHTRGQACHERIGKLIDEARKNRSSRPSFERELQVMCPACRLFGCGRLVSSVKVTDFIAVEDQQGEELAQEFVAIDRFTGGASGGAKFDATGRMKVTYRGELVLELGQYRADAAIAAPLLLAVRDLLLGDVPLGFGWAKGMGEYRARVSGADWYLLGRPLALRSALPAQQLITGGTTDVPSKSLDDLRQWMGEPLAAALDSWVVELDAADPASARRKETT